MNDLNAKEKLSQISDNWFMEEPFLFNVLCTHQLEENKNQDCMFRAGRGKIQYNPQKINSEGISNVSHKLKAEVTRIILKHPYQRVPDNPNYAALTRSSDITLNEHCDFKDLTGASHYAFSEGLAYEEYYTKLKYICPDNEITLSKNKSLASGGPGGEESEEDDDDKDEDLDFEMEADDSQSDSESKSKKPPKHTQFDDYFEAAQKSELWENDEMLSERINFEIEKAQKTKQWGSLSGNMIEEILASVKIPMDYRRILSQFRASIISQRRKLTRMKPNRRYGFDYMGSKFEPKTKLMVGVDVSGSISKEDLEHFYSIINQFFSYGVESVKVVSFDTKIQQETELKKAKREIKVTGRGGTNFQLVMDLYMDSSDYQGLIIFTDGYASKPTLSRKKDILWILTGKNEYDDAKEWIKSLGNKATWIPRKK